VRFEGWAEGGGGEEVEGGGSGGGGGGGGSQGRKGGEEVGGEHAGSLAATNPHKPKPNKKPTNGWARLPHSAAADTRPDRPQTHTANPS